MVAVHFLMRLIVAAKKLCRSHEIVPAAKLQDAPTDHSWRCWLSVRRDFSKEIINRQTGVLVALQRLLEANDHVESPCCDSEELAVFLPSAREASSIIIPGATGSICLINFAEPLH